MNTNDRCEYAPLPLDVGPEDEDVTNPGGPYIVKAWTKWADTEPAVRLGFVNESGARWFASLLPHPVVDLYRIGHGMIGIRRLDPAGVTYGRDDFPDTRA